MAFRARARRPRSPTLATASSCSWAEWRSPTATRNCEIARSRRIDSFSKLSAREPAPRPWPRTPLTCGRWSWGCPRWRALVWAWIGWRSRAFKRRASGMCCPSPCAERDASQKRKTGKKARQEALQKKMGRRRVSGPTPFFFHGKINRGLASHPEVRQRTRNALTSKKTPKFIEKKRFSSLHFGGDARRGRHHRDFDDRGAARL